MQFGFVQLKKRSNKKSSFCLFSVFILIDSQLNHLNGIDTIKSQLKLSI